MPFGADAPLLSFKNHDGLTASPLPRLPDWVQDAMETATDEDEFDHLLSEAGAVCIENYGATESMEVWRLSLEEPGWMIIHFDGDQPDMVFYIKTVLDYAAFQAQWMAPMAQKIMAEEQYWHWHYEMHQQSTEHSKVH